MQPISYHLLQIKEQIGYALNNGWGIDVVVGQKMLVPPDGNLAADPQRRFYIAGEGIVLIPERLTAWIEAHKEENKVYDNPYIAPGPVKQGFLAVLQAMNYGYMKAFTFRTAKTANQVAHLVRTGTPFQVEVEDTRITVKRVTDQASVDSVVVHPGTVVPR